MFAGHGGGVLGQPSRYFYFFVMFSAMRS